MSKNAETTKWEKYYYWPFGKAAMTSPKARLIIELIDIFSMVVLAALGGINLALAVVTGDKQGLFFTQSNSSLRYQEILIGISLIFLSLAIGIVRRIILSPPAHQTSGE